MKKLLEKPWAKALAFLLTLLPGTAAVYGGVELVYIYVYNMHTDRRLDMLWAVTAVCAVAAAASLVFSLSAAGHWPGHEGIHLTWVEKIPVDLFVLGLTCVWYIYLDAVYYPSATLGLAVFVALAYLFVLAFTARCKAGTVLSDLLALRLNLPLRTGVSDDSDSYSQERPGYDFADTFQLREYVPGDSAKQIHWKLSSKLNRLVVRDPGLPLERSVLLLWERRAECETPRQASAMAELVVSLARELLRQGVRCQAAWNDAAGQDCALYELEDETALYDMLPKLLSAAASRGLESAAELYLRQYGRPNGKTVYISAGDCPALERLCDPAELVGLFCAAEAPRDFPGRSYCFDPAAEDALYEIDLY